MAIILGRIYCNAKLERASSQSQHKFDMRRTSAPLGNGLCMTMVVCKQRLQQWMHARHKYLVFLEPKLACSYFELEDMIWSCQHIMVWDDCDGWESTAHFHPCWCYTSTLQQLFEPKLPCFLTNDLAATEWCFPPKAIVKKGRHRVVRI